MKLDSIKSIPVLNKFEPPGNGSSINQNTYISINLVVIKMNVTMWLIYLTRTSPGAMMDIRKSTGVLI